MKEYIKYWTKLIKESQDYSYTLYEYIEEFYGDKDNYKKIIDDIYYNIAETIDEYFTTEHKKIYKIDSPFNRSICDVIKPNSNDIHLLFDIYVDDDKFVTINDIIYEKFGVNLIIDGDKFEKHTEYDDEGNQYYSPTKVFLEVGNQEILNNYINENYMK